MKLKSNYNLSKTVATLLGAGILIGILDSGWNPMTIYGILVWFVVSGYLLIEDHETYVVVDKEQKLLVIKRGALSKSRGVPINHILKIKRIQKFVIPKWGSSIEISYQSNQGEESIKIIEKPFGAKTVKMIIQAIYNRNSNVDLDPQYLRLIQGELPEKGFLELKATHER